MTPEVRAWLRSKVRAEVAEMKESLEESRRLLKEYEARCKDPAWNSTSLPGLPAGLGTKSCWWIKVKKWKKEVKKSKKSKRSKVAP